MSNSKIQLSAKHYKRLGLIMMISGVLLIAIIIILLIVLKGSLSTSAVVFALVGTFLVIGGLALIIAGVVFVLKSLTAPKTVPPITAKQVIGTFSIGILKFLVVLALFIVVGCCVSLLRLLIK